jgi:choline dehydrogenase-like flavoprotein
VIEEGRRLAAGTTLVSEVCVIGGGPAGLTLAAELAGAGIDVLLLESGGRAPERRARSLARGSVSGEPYYPLHKVRVRMLGGTSGHWLPEDTHWPGGGGMRARPLDESDFERREHVPWSGWPFGLDTLAPYYGRASSYCGLPGSGFGLAEWAEAGRHRPIEFSPAAVVRTVPFLFGRRDAFVRLGERLAAAPGPRLVLHTTATDLRLAEGSDAVREARCLTVDGAPLVARAKVFVLAGGAIENPRLLLASRGQRAAGLGNGHDLVGRFFMEHPAVQSGVLELPSDGDLGFYRPHRTPSGRLLGALVLSPEVRAREGLLNACFFLFPVAPALYSPAGRSLQAIRFGVVARRRPAAMGRNVMQVMRDPVNAARALMWALACWPETGHYQLHANLEQAPDAESRVVLSGRRDRLGQPAADLRLAWTGKEARTLRRSQELIDGALRGAGLGRLTGLYGDEWPPPDFLPTNHHLGTTRMNADAARGVVDPDCRVHDVANLYVAGGSVFPTGGYANPTYTMVALAIRLADHLRHVLRP